MVEVRKEVISPGTVWYNDLKTGEPKVAIITPEHVKHWCDEGNKMLSSGLTVPVPCEHDFDAHPMTPAEKLKNNAGWVKRFELEGDSVWGILDIQDEELAKKLPNTVRWTSPWFSSFTDGNGNKWKNVITHLALTTRPRFTNQAPFPSLAAAIDAATQQQLDDECVLSRAGMLRTVDRKLIPEHPIAFSLFSGAALSDEELGESKNKLADSPEDMKLDKLLCDLLSILGVPMPENVSGAEFKKTLYMAAMQKIKELSQKPAAPVVVAPTPAAKKPAPLAQEQHPMYMTLEEINKIEDATTKNLALSMYTENEKLRTELAANRKVAESLRDSKLIDEAAKRKARVERLGRVSPKVKADLEAMLALPSMALSMGDGGVLVDPLDATLNILEKGLGDIPALLSTEVSGLQIVPQPTDGMLTAEEEDRLAEQQARFMGCPPQKQAS